MSNCNNCMKCSGWRCNPNKSYINQSAKIPSVYSKKQAENSYAESKNAYAAQTSDYQSHSASSYGGYVQDLGVEHYADNSLQNSAVNYTNMQVDKKSVAYTKDRI